MSYMRQERRPIQTQAREFTIQACVASEALQVRGAGYTSGLPAESCRRDARLARIFEGTSGIRQGVVSDRLPGC